MAGLSKILVTGLVGFCQFSLFLHVFFDTSKRAATARSAAAGVREAGLRLQQRQAGAGGKLWTRGTIELRNAVRGALLDVSYSATSLLQFNARYSCQLSHSSQSACVSAKQHAIRGLAAAV